MSRALVLFLLAAGAPAQTISLHIETESGQSQFRIGEQIGLKLVFAMASPEPAAPGWQIHVQGRDRIVLGLGSDRFIVSPWEGTSDPWEYRKSGAIAYSGPVAGSSATNRTKSASI